MDLKKIVIFVLALVLLMTVVLGVLLTGGFFEEKPSVVGLCVQEKDDPVWAEHYQQLVAALEETGYEVELRDASNDQAKQNLQIDNLLEAGCRLFVVDPVMTSAAEEVVSRLESANAAAVFIGNEADASVMASYERICYVGTDASQLGVLQGRILLNTPNQGDINGDGCVSYLVIQGEEDHFGAQQQTMHCNDAIIAQGLEAQQLELCYGDWDQDTGRKECAVSLSRLGKDIEVVFCGDDTIATGALTAIEAGGRTVGQDIYLVGADGTRESLQLVAEGKLTGTILYDYQGLSEKILEILGRLQAGERLGSRFVVDCIQVDATNIKEYTK